ncbi:hypothetical protein SAMN04488023_11563 [Pedobacter rhizosphaerae]|uniref:Uncharacterized protein n=1 Tax=Pedobacter rhizosphaerae TaxID=390241 RepID=A0A1H9RPS6_9SPHI|nr:hypothetical protein SAMN04488023_11563 [Pedobacter rhizosphaerae]
MLVEAISWVKYNKKGRFKFLKQPFKNFNTSMI